MKGKQLELMGRHQLNRTKEELDEMNRIRRNRHYKNHQEEEKKKSLKRYYKKKSTITDGEKPFNV